MFAIYDSTVKAYGNPMCFRTVGEALRAWKQLANDARTQFNQYPLDYSMMEIGTYCPYTSDTTKITPISHGLADQFLEVQTKLNGSGVHLLGRDNPAITQLAT